MRDKEQHIKLAIYSGEIPATTFIERLIRGLAEQNEYDILLFGNKTKDVSYPDNVHIYPAPAGRVNTLWYIITHILKLMVLRPKDVGRFLSIVRSYKGYKLRYMAKVLPVLLHRPDIFHIQWAKSLADWIWVKDLGVKLVLSLRGAHINYSPVVDSQLADTYSQLFGKVDAFHAVSDEIANKARAYGARHIKTIYSGFEYSAIPFKELKWAHRPLHIISVGRWHWVKGYNYAIDAMQQLRNSGFAFHYTIIAGIPDEQHLYHINSLGLDEHITIEKSMPHAEVLARIASADVLLLPSIIEGVANVVLEAMAVGTPVVVTDCGGVCEVIRDGHNGFIVPVRDSQAIADRLQSIARLSTGEIGRITGNARRTIEENHSIGDMIRSFGVLYKEVLNG